MRPCHGSSSALGRGFFVGKRLTTGNGLPSETGDCAGGKPAGKISMLRGMPLTPLCPAGHLPHKEGDRQDALPPLHPRPLSWSRPRGISISPLVGEMPGRAEGGEPHPPAPTNPPITRQTQRHRRSHITKKGDPSRPFNPYCPPAAGVAAAHSLSALSKAAMPSLPFCSVSSARRPLR